MTGTYQHTIDAKGRLFIPARLRDDLGRVFHVTLSMEKCLCAYSNDSWEQFLERTKAKPIIEQTRLRVLYSNAAKCEPDSQGRIIIPQALRNLVGLEKNVAVVGAGTCVQFWDSETFEEVNARETTLENIANMFAELSV
jgi:MraZ protein